MNKRDEATAEDTSVAMNTRALPPRHHQGPITRSEHKQNGREGPPLSLSLSDSLTLMVFQQLE